MDGPPRDSGNVWWSGPAGAAGSRALAAIPIAAAVVFYVVFVARSAFRIDGRVFFSLFDDAMISMRYGRNLAHGDGLVWNPGESVEGYSNFLWTVWMGALHLLPVSDAKASLLVMASGLATLVGTLFLVRAITAIVVPGNRLAIVAALSLTAFYYPLAFWTLRGMEVGLVTFLVYAAVLLALRLQDSFESRDLVLLGLALSAAVLTRDDAIVPSLVVLGFLLLTLAREHRLRLLVVAGGMLLVAVAGHEAFRVAYYGEALANTYYLKLEGVTMGVRLERGAAALLNTGLTQLYAPLILACAGLALRPGTLRRAPGLLAALVLGHCAYAVYVGGDAWEFFDFGDRFITPAVPALAILAVAGLDAVLTAPTARLRRLVVPVAVVFALVAVAQALMATSTPLSRRVGTVLNAPLHEHPWTYLLLGLALGIAVLVLLGARLSARGAGRAPAAAAAAAVALFAALNGPQLVRWADHNAYVSFDTAMARYGVALERGTRPDASIAVTWAGAPPYFFGDRHAVDIMGKADAAIARGPSHAPWRPGHSKWNLDYTLRRYRPDVVAHLPPAGITGADARAIRRHGYRLLPRTRGVLLLGGAALVSGETQAVDAPALDRSIPSLCPGGFAPYCAQFERYAPRALPAGQPVSR